MASTTVTPTAVFIQTALAALVISEPVKAYAQPVGMAGLDALPAAEVGLPTLERVQVEDPESQLGTTDWRMTFPVALYVDLGDVTTACTLLVEFVEAFVKAIDNNVLTVSDSTIIDAKVVHAEPSEIADESRPMLAYECRLELLKLV